MKTLDLGTYNHPRLICGAVDDDTIRNLGQIPLEVRTNQNETCLGDQPLFQPVAVVHVRPCFHELIHHKALFVGSGMFGMAGVVKTTGSFETSLHPAVYNVSVLGRMTP